MDKKCQACGLPVGMWDLDYYHMAPDLDPSRGDEAVAADNDHRPVLP